MEPPAVFGGYGLAVAFASFLEIIRSLSTLLEKSPFRLQEQKSGEDKENITPKSELKPIKNDSAKEKKLYCQLINSSWCGILSALVPLIDGRYKKYETQFFI